MHTRPIGSSSLYTGIFKTAIISFSCYLIFLSIYTCVSPIHMIWFYNTKHAFMKPNVINCYQYNMLSGRTNIIHHMQLLLPLTMESTLEHSSLSRQVDFFHYKQALNKIFTIKNDGRSKIQVFKFYVISLKPKYLRSLPGILD